MAGASIVAALLGSLAPDLDAGESKIKNLRVLGVRPFHAIATLTHRHFGHRALLHSLAGLGLAALLVSVPLAVYVGWSPAFAFLLGYGSHLLLDACTVRGIRWLYPDPRRFHVLPPDWRIVTGSAGEEVFALFLLIPALLLFMVLALRLTFPR